MAVSGAVIQLVMQRSSCRSSRAGPRSSCRGVPTRIGRRIDVPPPQDLLPDDPGGIQGRDERPGWSRRSPAFPPGRPRFRSCRSCRPARAAMHVLDHFHAGRAAARDSCGGGRRCDRRSWRESAERRQIGADEHDPAVGRGRAKLDVHVAPAPVAEAFHTAGPAMVC